MADGSLDAARAVQVVVRDGDACWLGSGYQVGADVVLTARHVVADAATVMVRFVDAPGRVREVAAHTVWEEAAIDMAVLRLAAAAAELPRVRYGRLTGPAACEAVGYPWFKLRDEHIDADAVHPGARRESHHARGTGTPWSNRISGTLELTVTAPPAHPLPGRKAWEGMSGAAVFAGGALIAIITDNYDREGPGLLTARLIEQWYDLPADRLAELRTLLAAPENLGRLDIIGEVPATASARQGLPREVATFTGRTAELDDLLASLELDRGGVLAIHAVDGLGGVGKSAFAVHAAHRLASRFPDGQVFLPLHAHTPGLAPVTPEDALAALLLGDGLATSELPEDLTAREQRWRERTADRRMLLILDDAADAAQVRPLLPAAPDTLVLVTSRRRLTGLDDAVPISLATLMPSEAAQLFVRTARQPSLTTNDPNVVELVEVCGHLPLAIGMIAARLKKHPRRTPAELIGQFRIAKSRLDELRDQNRTVAAAFDLSYRDLAPDQQRLFRLLGASPGIETDPPAAAALLDTDITTARHLLEDLEDHRLIDEQATIGGRYRMHDLIREHASTLAVADQTEAAVDRLLTYYQYIAAPRGDTSSAPPVMQDREKTLAWLRVERENLFSCHRYAINCGKGAHIVGLSAALAPLLRAEGPWTDALPIHQLAAATAHRLSDRLGQANALSELGAVRRLTDDYLGAAEALDQALEIFSEVGDRRGQADALTTLGTMRRLTGDYPGAAEAVEQALGLYQELGTRRGQAGALGELGAVRALTGDYPGAAEALEQALGLYQELDNRRGQAYTLEILGAVRWRAGDYPGGAEAHEQALGLYQELGNRRGQADALTNLGEVRQRTGDYPGAAEALERALGLYQEVGHRGDQANALNNLGAVRALTGDYPGAVEALEQALGLHQELGHRVGQSTVLRSLGDVSATIGHFQQAQSQYADAIRIAHEIAAQLEEAQALEALGECEVLLENLVAGVRHLHQAWVIYERLGVPAAHRAGARLKEIGLENTDSLK